MEGTRLSFAVNLAFAYTSLRRRGINSQSIDMIIEEYSGFNTMRVKGMCGDSKGVITINCKVGSD